MGSASGANSDVNSDFDPGPDTHDHASPSESSDNDSDRDRDEAGPRHHLGAYYNNAYRLLFNDDIRRAATRFETDTTDDELYEKQVGASIWSAEEQATFFAALERLGRDNVPGIAAAIRTKSIPETQELLLLLHDAATAQGDAGLTLRHVPAALEVGSECIRQLDLAGHSLAWHQEMLEASQERDRFGDYWLMTAAIAEQIEDARNLDQAQATGLTEPADTTTTATDIRQAIPEADLLHLQTMLTLSKTLFMNRSSTIPSPWPHWSEYSSEIANEPAIYRTAFNDFHTLAVSVTKRLMQTALIQATSRLRSEKIRVNRGGRLVVKEKDVLAALSILGMKRNGRERWRGAARRCGIRVFTGRRDRYRRSTTRREISWNTVEELLADTEPLTETLTTDAEASGNESAGFKAKATLSNTTLPMQQLALSDTADDSVTDDDDGSADDIMYGSMAAHERSMIRKTQSRDLARRHATMPPASDGEGSQACTITLERFDQEASQQYENTLWEMLGREPATDGEGVETDEDHEAFGDDEKITTLPQDWRSWTDYRPEWEEFDTPVPASKFVANQKLLTAPPIHGAMTSNTTDAGSGTESEALADDSSEGLGASRRNTEKSGNPIELQALSARAYAARNVELDASSESEDSSGSEDGSRLSPQQLYQPIQSVEAPSTKRIIVSSDDEPAEMDWEAYIDDD